MFNIFNRVGAQIRGRTGQRKHRKIVDNVFATRDALEASAVNMSAEMDSNNLAIRALRDRNFELRSNATHAQTVAKRLGEFFLTR